MPQVDFNTFFSIIFWLILILTVGFLTMNVMNILNLMNNRKKNENFFEKMVHKVKGKKMNEMQKTQQEMKN